MRTNTGIIVAGNENSVSQALHSMSSVVPTKTVENLISLFKELSDKEVLEEGRIYGVLIGDEESRPARTIVYEQDLGEGLILYVIL